MNDIFDFLMQAIDESSFSYITPKTEHRREAYRAEQHLQWLREHLTQEAQEHLEQLMNAEMQMALLEDKALVKTAIAVGVRLAFPT